MLQLHQIHHYIFLRNKLEVTDMGYSGLLMYSHLWNKSHTEELVMWHFISLYAEIIKARLNH